MATTPVTLSPHLVEAFGELAPLYEQRSATEVADAYLSLDLETRELGCGTEYQGDGVSLRRQHGFIITERVPSEISGAGLKTLAENAELLRVARDVCDKYEKVWDGYDHVAWLTDTGEAEAEWSSLIERAAKSVHTVEVWQAGDWLSQSRSDRKDGRGVCIGDHTITPKTSNEALGKMAAALTKEAADQVLVGVTKHLDEVRARVVERAKERAREEGLER